MIMKPWDPTPVEIFTQSKNKTNSGIFISVIVTNYNYGKYIEKCLDSIHNQTFDKLELVVIDDKSEKDDSIDVIHKWMKKNYTRFEKCTLLSNKTNQGPSFSRNSAINYAKSEYIFMMDADNEIFPSAISKLFSALMKTSAAGSYSQIVDFGERNQIGVSDIWDANRMRQNNYVDVMALIKKKAWEDVGGFSHIEEGWEDYDFWLKFIDKKLDLCFLPEILCKYRVHNSSRTAKEAFSAHFILENLMKFRHP
ncbi:glycosyltransferase family 2 protein [Acetobacter sp. AN02]|uniref:glycosyltransferase family 2 protein n=1 Tax=Acetobacter sp. AN02 TaxID=2894186 RepID=UPI0024343C04|nr:glycosyltransferase family A protein [Acetobacter sp. AN02]MDG6095752.1 glycosyltransferase family 2 protein [Acetobacter sp. AN02]